MRPHCIKGLLIRHIKVLIGWNANNNKPSPSLFCLISLTHSLISGLGKKTPYKIIIV